MKNKLFMCVLVVVFGIHFTSSKETGEHLKSVEKRSSGISIGSPAKSELTNELVKKPFDGFRVNARLGKREAKRRMDSFAFGALGKRFGGEQFENAKRSMDPMMFAGRLGRRIPDPRFYGTIGKRTLDSMMFHSGLGKRMMMDNALFRAGVEKRRLDSALFSGGVGKRMPNFDDMGGVDKRRMDSAFASMGIGKRPLDSMAFRGAVGKR